MHVIAAAFGLSALLAHVPTAYVVLKFVGAAYLVWLGVSMLRSAGVRAEAPSMRKKSAKRAFVDSFLVEFLNPKTAIFFLAFLPQFVDPAGAFPIWVQFLILGAAVNLAFGSADLVAVFFTSYVMAKLKKSGPYQKLSQWLAGSLMILLGIRLALSNE